MNEEVELMKNELISDRELQKLKNSIESDLSSILLWQELLNLLLIIHLLWSVVSQARN